MSDSAHARTCGVCHRELDAEDQWIELDGGEVWCAECWQRRYALQSMAPASEEGEVQEAAGAEGGAQQVCGACGWSFPLEEEACTVCGAIRGVGSSDIQLSRPAGTEPSVTDAQVSPAQSSPAAVAAERPGALGAGAGQGTGAVSHGRTSVLALASFVLSLVGAFGLVPMMGLLRAVAPSVVTFVLTVIIMVLGPATGTTAVILGAVAMAAISRDPALEGRGKAVAGLVIGIGDVTLWIMWITYFAYLVDSIAWPWN